MSKLQYLILENNLRYQCLKYRQLAIFVLSNSYTMVCPPVRGDNPRALASGLSPVQADEPWYNYFIPLSSMWTLLRMKYFVLKFAITGKCGIKCRHM